MGVGQPANPGDAVASSAGYEWSDEWHDPAGPDLAMTHTGLVITREGSIVSGAPGESVLAVRDRQGALIGRVDIPTGLDVHDLTLVEEDGRELIWIADTATRLYGGEASLKIDRVATHGAVRQVDLEGTELRVLDRPALDVYDSVGYRPTAVAVDERRLGGSGDIWVADGYGASLVHRYDEHGRYLDSIDGEGGAGRFKEPHDIIVDRRGAAPLLYVADRVNARIQVYDLDGSFRRTVGAGLMPGPTQMAVRASELFVTDLLAGRVTVFDADDHLVAHLFPEPSPPPAWDQLPDAWPNARADNGMIVGAKLQNAVFHTPHGIVVDVDRTIYVSEFSIGGRVSLLTPTSAA